MKIIISGLLIHTVLFSSLAFGQSYLSPVIKATDTQIQSFFLNLQKDSIQNTTISFLDSLSPYLSKTESRLPIQIINQSVLLSSLINNSEIPEGAEVPLTLNNLSIINKLLKKKKVILIADEANNGTAVFKILPYAEYVPVKKLAQTINDEKIWNNEIEKYLKAQRKTHTATEQKQSSTLKNFEEKLLSLQFEELRFLVHVHSSYVDKNKDLNITRHPYFINLFKSIQKRNALPDLSTIILFLDESDRAKRILVEYINSKLAKTKKNEKNKPFSSKEFSEFIKISETNKFKHDIAGIIQRYFEICGEEAGSTFFSNGRSVKKIEQSLISMQTSIEEISGLFSIHTHNFGLIKYDHTFFVPSWADIEGDICMGGSITCIIWGDPEFGFYLTITDLKDSKLAKIAWEHQFNNVVYNQNNPLIFKPYQTDLSNFRFFKLIPEGTRRKRGLAFAYSLKAINPDPYFFKSIEPASAGALKRIYNYWGDDQRVLLSETCNNLEKKGENPLAFLYEQLSQAKQEIARLATEKTFKSELSQSHQDQSHSQIYNEILTEHEKIQQETLIKIINGLIKRKEKELEQFTAQKNQLSLESI